MKYAALFLALSGFLLLPMAWAKPVTNDTAKLVPRTEPRKPMLEFDFPGMEIGIAEYPQGPTGCTVFNFLAGVYVASDPRGGKALVAFSNQHKSGDSWTDSICFAGGSTYGMEAAAGVGAELFKMRKYNISWWSLPVSTGAAFYDFHGRNNAIYPDKALGRAALRDAKPGAFPLGRQGAGLGALVGQGAAVTKIDGVRVGVFTVINTTAAIVNSRGQVKSKAQKKDAVQNSVLTLVVTDKKLNPLALVHLARQVHSALGNAIRPLNGPHDGDALFAVSYANGVDGKNLDNEALGNLASKLAWESVLSSLRDSDD